MVFVIILSLDASGAALRLPLATVIALLPATVSAIHLHNVVYWHLNRQEVPGARR